MALSIKRNLEVQKHSRNWTSDLKVISIIAMILIQACGVHPTGAQDFTSRDLQLFISKFPPMQFPFKFGKALARTGLTVGKEMDDSQVERFVVKKEAPGDIPIYRFRYFASAIKDSLACVLYTKIGAAGGIQYIYELVVYDLSAPRLLDRMTLFELSSGHTQSAWYEGEINSNLEIVQDYYVRTSDANGQSETVKERSNKLKITREGIVVLDGRKEKATSW